MMAFGIENDEHLQSAIAIANAIQGVIPEGSNGGQVMAAMTMLMGHAMREYMPPHEHDNVKEHIMATIDDVLEGRIVLRTIKEH